MHSINNAGGELRNARTRPIGKELRVVADGFEKLSFIIPLGTKPDQCYDAITPRGMRSSMSCAWSGALLEAGSMSGTVWSTLQCTISTLWPTTDRVNSSSEISVDSPRRLLGRQAYTDLHVDSARPWLGSASPIPGHITAFNRPKLPPGNNMHPKPQGSFHYLVWLADRIRMPRRRPSIRHHRLLPSRVHKEPLRPP